LKLLTVSRARRPPPARRSRPGTSARHRVPAGLRGRDEPGNPPRRRRARPHLQDAGRARGEPRERRDRRLPQAAQLRRGVRVGAAPGIGALRPPVQIPRHKEGIDFGPGNLRSTGEPLDLAIAGDGFFTLATDRGERYTRAGAFQVDDQGFVVAANGARVAGANGPLQLDPARGRPTIDEAGNVSQDGESVGALKIVAFERNDALVAEGSGLFRAGNDARQRPAPDARVEQGSLEDANVDVVDELVQMIGGFRAFEAAQRSLLGIDRVRTQAVSGR
jgi:flagellar basal body rod protein FlgF